MGPSLKNAWKNAYGTKYSTIMKERTRLFPGGGFMMPFRHVVKRQFSARLAKSYLRPPTKSPEYDEYLQADMITPYLSNEPRNVLEKRLKTIQKSQKDRGDHAKEERCLSWHAVQYEYLLFDCKEKIDSLPDKGSTDSKTHDKEAVKQAAAVVKANKKKEKMATALAERKEKEKEKRNKEKEYEEPLPEILADPELPIELNSLKMSRAAFMRTLPEPGTKRIRKSVKN